MVSPPCRSAAAPARTTPRRRPRRRSAPSSAASARSKRSGSSVSRVISGWPSVTWSPGRACQRTPAPAWTGSSLRDRPAPSRQAAMPTARASSRVSTPDGGRGHDVRLAGDRERGVRVAALGADHRLPGVHRGAVGELVGRVDVVPPAPASISRARARVSSTTSAGPPPASTSTDSSTSIALPAVRPSGVRHVGEQRDRVHAGVGAERDHRLGQLAGPVDGPS